MKGQLPEDIDAIAMDYVLGLIERAEREAFDEALEGDDSRTDLLRTASEAAAVLAQSVSPVTPPPQIKSRFLQTIRESSTPQLGVLLASEGVWKRGSAEGITYKKLYFDKESGLITMLVRMAPGASFPQHKHSRVEQCLVLEGDLIHDDHVYGPGDFTWAEAGSIDPALHTRTGNLLLIIGAPETKKG